MVTVAEIAARAYDAVGAKITDAIKDATLSGSDAGRVVFGGSTAPNGFPISTAKDRTRQAYLEGFGSVATVGDTLETDDSTFHILGVRDVVEAGGLVVARVINAADMTWQDVTFETATRTQSESGGYSDGWAAIAGLDPVRAGVSALSGSEVWASMRTEARSKWQVWFKSDVSLKEGDRALIKGKPFNITFINDVEARGVWRVVELDGGVAT